MVSSCSAGGSETKEPVRDGVFKVKFAKPSKKLAAPAAELKSSGMIQFAVKKLNSAYRLPDDVTIFGHSCADGPAYDPETLTIDYCYESVAEDRQLLKDAKDSTADDTQAGIIVETVYHEAGHALIDAYGLPFTGHEEDVADQFAAYMLLDRSDAESDHLLSAAYDYELLYDAYDQSDSSDEHAPDDRRASNYLCYAYGSDPEGYKDLVDDDWLTKARADYCEDEWFQVKRGWSTLLKRAHARV